MGRDGRQHWDLSTTKNWKSGSTAAIYADYSADVFTDAQGTSGGNISIVSGGVTPTAVVCVNNANS